MLKKSLLFASVSILVSSRLIAQVVCLRVLETYHWADGTQTSRQISFKYGDQKECEDRRDYFFSINNKPKHVNIAYLENCVECSKSGDRQSSQSSQKDLTKYQNIENAKRDMKELFFTAELVGWYKNIISPLEKGNLLKLSALFPNNLYFSSALQTLGTAASSIEFARGYIRLFQLASENSLKKAMDIINLQESDWNRYLHSAGSAVYYAPPEFANPEDNYVALQAFEIALDRSSYSNPIDDYSRAALYIAMGLIATETDNKNFSAFAFRQSANYAANINNSKERTIIAKLIYDCNKDFELNIDPADYPSLFNMLSALPNLAGDYEMICPSCEKDESELSRISTVKKAPTVITQNESMIKIEERSIYYIQAIESNNTNIGARTMVIESIGVGTIKGNNIYVDAQVTANQPAWTTTLMGTTVTNPATNYKSSISYILEILPNGDLQGFKESGEKYILKRKKQ